MADAFERRLFVARRRAEKRIAAERPDLLRAQPVVPGDLLQGPGDAGNLPLFYPDLQSDAACEASLCVFHQRFSTNTWPQWRLAQPFRYLAHNGEINTIQGNRNWARARSYKFDTPLLPDMDDIRPLVSDGGPTPAAWTTCSRRCWPAAWTCSAPCAC